MSAALAIPGVPDVILATDIPGDPMLASFAHDEPVFARDTVQHVGQVIGLVVADTVMQARRAARQVECRIDALSAILNVRDALAAQSYVPPPVFVRRGDARAALKTAAHTLHSTLEFFRRCRNRVVSLQDEHPEPHRLPRLWRAARNDRDRGHHGRYCAPAWPESAGHVPT